MKLLIFSLVLFSVLFSEISLATDECESSFRSSRPHMEIDSRYFDDGTYEIEDQIPNVAIRPEAEQAPPHDEHQLLNLPYTRLRGYRPQSKPDNG